MTTRDYLDVVRRQWRIIATVTLVGLIGGIVLFLVRPATYTAQVDMYVSAQSADTTNSAFEGAQLSQQRVASYLDLIPSRRVSEEVISQLGLATTPEKLGERISATSALDSVVIQVAVEDRSPVAATQIANSVSDVFTRLVADLERPVLPNTAPVVAVRIVQPAVEPLHPSSTSLPLSAALGLAIGLALGVGAAFLRHNLDRSVLSQDDLRAVTKAPTLGSVAFSPEASTRPLIVLDTPGSSRSEAFRQIRTNLQFIDVDNPPTTLMVTSSVPGEGKSTTLVNLATAMATAGRRVLVIDADLRRPRIAGLLDLERGVGLTTVLTGRVPLSRAIQSWRGTFDVLTSGSVPPNPGELLASDLMSSVLKDLHSRYDTILIDTPPLLPVSDAAALAPGTDGAILVCRYKETKSPQLATAVNALEAVSAPVVGTVLTMTPDVISRDDAKYRSYYASVQTDQQANGHNRPRPETADPRSMDNAGR